MGGMNSGQIGVGAVFVQEPPQRVRDSSLNTPVEIYELLFLGRTQIMMAPNGEYLIASETYTKLHLPSVGVARDELTKQLENETKGLLRHIGRIGEKIHTQYQTPTKSLNQTQ